jgi:2-amino-4-hydroxy-6-hydroxymethyldihydropteridine diphosphokinase
VATITAAIALGSNVGDRYAHIAFALESLGTLPSSRLTAHSRVIETAPVGPLPQGAYLNAAATLETDLSARDLLGYMLEIERRRGRNRPQELRWGPRTLDLDLLLYGDRTIHEPGLEVPHPRLPERAFVLEPLAEILPDVLVPGLDKSVAALLQELRASSPF